MSILTLGALPYIRAASKPAIPTSEETRRTPVLMTWGCLTTKHHDGFCLWPTATGVASVKDTSQQTDVVKAYVNSFRSHGLKVALYYSILELRNDIRHFNVTVDKIKLIKEQLTELLTNYGKDAELKQVKQVVEEWLIPLNKIHCNLILNAAPNREGKLAPNVVNRLEEIGRAWRHPGPNSKIDENVVITTTNLATGRKILASDSPDTVGAGPGERRQFPLSFLPSGRAKNRLAGD
jgi:hypothetical protein